MSPKIEQKRLSSRSIHLGTRLLVCILAALSVVLSFSADALKLIDGLGSLALPLLFYSLLGSTIFLPVILGVFTIFSNLRNVDAREWAIDWLFMLAWCAGFWIFVLFAISNYSVL